MTDKERIAKAIELAIRFGGIDGDHHKAWVIDRMVRALTGCSGEFAENKTEEYAQLVAEACSGEDGPNTYEWNEGIPP